jgi:ABC-type nickel/cobalt efflux system permease component RcnA
MLTKWVKFSQHKKQRNTHTHEQTLTHTHTHTHTHIHIHTHTHTHIEQQKYNEHKRKDKKRLKSLPRQFLVCTVWLFIVQIFLVYSRFSSKKNAHVSIAQFNISISKICFA